MVHGNLPPEIDPNLLDPENSKSPKLADSRQDEWNVMEPSLRFLSFLWGKTIVYYDIFGKTPWFTLNFP